MLERIYIIGEPILRKQTPEIEKITQAERELFDEMLKVMRRANGIGLAANQVGIDKQMCVICIEDKVLKLANPRVIKKKGQETIEEGCLSLPGITVKVKRAREITCQALDENNQQIEFEADDLLSRAIQHEVDHLMGKLIIDYASVWQKVALKEKIKVLKNKQNKT
ncbi:MAG: peptide deformylase [Candidatus Omnitrophota bacterium]|nr:peptide deformylase [Candidatus Omnitrophota bacterium]